jgi:hypothetical protein
MSGGAGVKRKGSNFEREAVALLMQLLPESEFKRMASSGAIGTYIGEPLLAGDIKGKIKGLTQTFRGEAKVGYGGAKQFALKKEWIDKIIMEAGNTYSIPFVIGKFSGARAGANVFVVLDINTFASLLNYITEQSEELDKLYEEKESKPMEGSQKNL